MTGHERIIAALQRRQPDAVPTFEWFIDKKVTKALVGTEDVLEAVEALDVDGVNVRADYTRRPLSATDYVDEWGTTRRTTGEALAAAVDYPVPDITRQAEFRFPDPAAPGRFASVEKALSPVRGTARRHPEPARRVFRHARDPRLRELPGQHDDRGAAFRRPAGQGRRLQPGAGARRPRAVCNAHRRHDRRHRQRVGAAVQPRGVLPAHRPALPPCRAGVQEPRLPHDQAQRRGHPSGHRLVAGQRRGLHRSRGSRRGPGPRGFQEALRAPRLPEGQRELHGSPRGRPGSGRGKRGAAVHREGSSPGAGSSSRRATPSTPA